MSSLRFAFGVLCISSVLLMCSCTTSATAEDDRNVYIVYMWEHFLRMLITHPCLTITVSFKKLPDSLIRNYGRSFNGFAARLAEAEREKLAGMEGVVSVFRSVKLKMLTTRSWDFIGFGDKIKHKHEAESDIVIGVIDSGIWPESKSFSDNGFGPPPKKWKGACKGGSNFTCNNKLIGARAYFGNTARDSIGHGTHTASTAAGNRVDNVNFYGIAEGTAIGGVPSARIAAYKVCEFENCTSDGILAAFDDAIADGVDIISVSLGGEAASFEGDTIAIGAFHAMAKGVLTVQAAGNEGPSQGTVGSIAPWVLTIAASTIDRRFVTKVVLGNHKEILGTSVNGYKLNGTKFPLSYGNAASSNSSKCDEKEAKRCFVGCIDNSVKGKILVCDNRISTAVAKHVGAVGLISQSKAPYFDVTSFPMSILAEDDFASLVSYINSTHEPQGTILQSIAVKDASAPVVASFSSRGPNTIIHDILKPDITAPGENILAAFSPIGPVTKGEVNGRSLSYSFLSATSMSCPHVAGVAAYVKSLHPDWSPSAIKSAIMTTAWAMNASTTKRMNEFAYGSGHINPTMAADPGLVYEATRKDYLEMLCAANFTATNLEIIAGERFSCPKGSNLKVRDLNYPSMQARVHPHASNPGEIKFSRTVTNVGTASATYNAKVTASGSKLHVEVNPKTLSFGKTGEKKSFTVKVSGMG